ncbi:hypothetical protein FN846DRAFT_896441 [Sphaerosporella brunnea]|uniref:Uncharacterized protein n=1 Tax=Sphaerosporella brunnea TaxID=1250544 RepID=A0A5J5ECW2_9PEZI|nr:hypothetical protein FN846DRAFT_896441 [Sphaerosporella brunnea]
MRRCTFLPMTADDYLLDDGTSMKPQPAGVHLTACAGCADSDFGYHSDTTDLGSKTSLQCHCRVHGDTLHLAGVSSPNIFSELDHLTLELQEYLKPSVVVAAVESFVGKDGRKPLVVAKKFVKKAYLLKELEAYAALAHLQGFSVPRCIGVFENCSPASDSPSILGEQGAIYLLLERCGQDIGFLEEEALAELGKIHAAGVAHGDISMNNVLVNPHDICGVGFVDFEMSEVYGESKRAEEDMGRFKMIRDRLRR